MRERNARYLPSWCFLWQDDGPTTFLVDGGRGWNMQGLQREWRAADDPWVLGHVFLCMAGMPCAWLALLSVACRHINHTHTICFWTSDVDSSLFGSTGRRDVDGPITITPTKEEDQDLWFVVTKRMITGTSVAPPIFWGLLELTCPAH